MHRFTWRLAVIVLLGWNNRYIPTAHAQYPAPAPVPAPQVAQAPARLPSVVPASMAYVNNLEMRIAELEARLDRYAAEHKDEKAPKPAEGYEVGSDLAMTAKWNHGFELSTKNKDFKVHVGGRVQSDTSWYSGNGNIENTVDLGGVGPLRDATNMRRGRIRIDGTMYETMDFASEWDFVNEIRDVGAGSTQADAVAVPCPTDNWVQFKELPAVGNFRIGILKDPWSFEHLTSSRWLNFMERSYGQDVFHGAFNNGFLPGAMFFDTMWEEHGTWWIGLFKNTNNIFANGVGDGELSTVGRLTWLPIYTDEGRYLLHFGVAARALALDEGRVRFRTRADIRSGAPGPANPIFANTGFIAGDNEQQIGTEVAGVWGPWSLQSEWFGAVVQDASTLANSTAAGLQPPPGTPLGTYMAHGAYVEVHYFLTGESRPYNRKNAVFDRVIPFQNFFLVRNRETGCCYTGWGAWQLAGRYQFMDLNDSGVNGGVLDAFTLGLNWFWNPNTKVQFNYDYMDRNFVNTLGNNGNGTMSSFGGRLAFDF